MEPNPTHQLYFTPTGQLTPAGRDAIASTRATARRLLAIRESIAMEPTPSPAAEPISFCQHWKPQILQPWHEALLRRIAAASTEPPRGPTIGRKRRQRRARGRRRGAGL